MSSELVELLQWILICCLWLLRAFDRREGR